MREYETVIGLEIHAQLRTRSKMFCSCAASYGELPNRNTCPLCLGMPGTLPVVNREAVLMAVRAGKALGCRINLSSSFDRKNYFYPDLSKGYQITQYSEPICTGGGLEIQLPDGSGRTVGITRIHLEEDAGKDIHLEGLHESLVDYNRCGVPLIEIVSEPDMRSSAEAVACLKELRNLLRYIGVCDGNMEEGSFRCDANISVMPKGSDRFGTRAELKNLNSFRFVAKGIEYEVQRQVEILEAGGRVVQETRLFDSRRGITQSMRSKEEAHDYRYFPEPDLLRLELDAAFVDSAEEGLHPLPWELRNAFMNELGLPAYDTEILVADKDLALWFLELGRRVASPKAAANWVMTEVLAWQHRSHGTISEFPVSAQAFARLIDLCEQGALSFSKAKELLAEALGGKELASLLAAEGTQIKDGDLLAVAARQAVAGFPAERERYLGGKTGVLSFFVGKVMQATSGKADPKLLPEIVRTALEEWRKE